VAKKVLLSWSSGKDSAWSLHALRGDPGLEVVGLLTTVNEAFDRVAMHAVRETLLEAQARAADLPLWKVPIPNPCPNEVYERAMQGVVARARDEGVEAMAFGDLFLEDIRAYRVRQLEGTGLEPLFPIWGIPTPELARQMVDGGLRARITCVDPRALDARFAGREWNAELLDELPEGVDPCGENGEFHTFAFAGPMFSAPIPVQAGPVVERDGFHFADLLPAGPPEDSPRAPESGP
jgi:uncharacterized protein (TIGR00290 family)